MVMDIEELVPLFFGKPKKEGCFHEILRIGFKGRRRISFAFAEQAIALARAYAQVAGVRGDDGKKKPSETMQHRRLAALIRHPLFLVDPCGVDIMIALKDLRAFEPWGFEMWSQWTSERHVLLPGMGERHINGLRTFILRDELWTGTNTEMQRVFFGSVAHALQLFSAAGFFAEAALPRIELIHRNAVHGNHHEPWCNAAFKGHERGALVELEKKNNAVAVAVRQCPCGVLWRTHCC